jgi:hypothetical protein
MAQSRHRHKHTHQHAHTPHTASHSRQQAKGKAIRIMMVFMGVLGLFVAYVSAGPELLWLIVGTAAGVTAGYFVGRSMDKAAAK